RISPLIYFCSVYGDLRHLPAFPTRRSSDLDLARRLRAPERAPAHLGAQRDEEVVARTGHAPGDHHHLRVQDVDDVRDAGAEELGDRKSTRLNSSHVKISYAVFCLKKKTTPR